MIKYYVMAGFNGKRDRIALICDSRKEAISRLNKEMKRAYKNANLWIDSFGQEFEIKRQEV